VKNTMTMGKRQRLLYTLFGVFVITAYIIGCSGKKAETVTPGENAAIKKVSEQVFQTFRTPLVTELSAAKPAAAAEEIQKKIMPEQTVNLREFGINLKTYEGYTPQTPNEFVTRISFSPNNRIEMWDEEEWAEKADRKNIRSGKYLLTNENGIDFLTIAWNNGSTEKLLFLTNNDNVVNGLYLYNSDSKPYFKRNDSAFSGGMVFGNNSWIKASSSLTETLNGKTVLYSPDKLGIEIGECWVPNEKRNAKLTLSINPSFQMDGENIYISSGFVSFSKPRLYSDNSRVKKIRLSDSSGNSRIVELKDTPHFQPVSVKGIGASKDSKDGGTSVLTVEILEVYGGTKYADICLNAICWKFSQ